MNVEIAKTKNNNAIAKPTKALDLSSMGGFSPVDLTPSNLVLVQGTTSLKAKTGAVDGDFVVNNAVVPQPLEFVLCTTERAYDEVEPIELDENNKLPEETVFIKKWNDIDAESLGLTEIVVEKKDMKLYTKIYKSDCGKMFQSKYNFLISCKGIPIKVVFKSPSKHRNARSLYQRIGELLSLNGLEVPQEAVFGLKSAWRDRTHPKTKKVLSQYLVFDIEFIRKATEKEFAAATIFGNMNFVDVKHEEDFNGAPF